MMFGVIRNNRNAYLRPNRRTLCFSRLVLSVHHRSLHHNHTIYSHGVNEDQLRIKKLLERLPYFTKSDYGMKISSYVEGEVDIDVDFVSRNALIDEFLHNNKNRTPTSGSFMEFIPSVGHVNKFGVVIEECSTRFNENFNKMTVLTTDNEIIKVSPQDISIHFYSVVKRSVLMASDVLENRHDSLYSKRTEVINIMKSFLHQAHSLQAHLAHTNQFETVYSQFQREYTVVPISILDFVTSFHKLPVSIDWDNCFNQASLAMACHLQMMNDPLKWIVPTAFRQHRISNVASIKEGYSNILPATTNYLVNSFKNCESIIELQKANASDIEDIKSFLSSFINLQANEQTRKTKIDLTLYFTLWEGVKYKYIIDVLKFYVLYPHSNIKVLLSHLIDGVDVSKVHLVLKDDLKIYTDGLNGSKVSDIYLSSAIIGGTDLDQVSISSTKELKNPITCRSSNRAHKFTDNFPHLRERKRFYDDLTIFSFNNGNFGVSIEKSNVRKFWINVHVPDVATKVSPNGEIFKALSLAPVRSSIENLVAGQSIDLLDSLILDQFKFSTRNVVRKAGVSVGDIESTNEPILDFKDDSPKTCMTISFAYYPFSSDPFSPLADKIRITFDDISRLQTKSLSKDSLENILLGKSEANKDRGFMFFKRRSPNQNIESLLSDKDEHDLRYIYNAIKTYSKVRNLNGASLIDETEQEDITSFSKSQNKQAEFFLKELHLLSEDSVANYCNANNIPVYSSSQNILQVSHEEINRDENQDKPVDMESIFTKPTLKETDLPKPVDEVYLTNNSIMLPEFYAASYYQTLLCRDGYGNISASARIGGKNFLAYKEIETTTEQSLHPLIPEGFLFGSVDVNNATSSFTSLMNQYQILSHIHQTNTLPGISSSQKFSYLVGLGYPEIPLSADMLKEEIPKFWKENEFKRSFMYSHKKFWALKNLELKIMTAKSSEILDIDSIKIDTTQFDCVVTHISQTEEFLPNKLARAYCSELGTEIEVLVNKEHEITIGSHIECDEIIYLNPIAGMCILGQQEVI